MHRKKRINLFRSKATVAFTVALLFFSSCHHNKKQYTDAITCRDSVSTITTRDITSLVSDSGVVRYRIVAPLWEVFDRLDPPKWAFEEGVYLEKFADSLTIDATVKADTAYYYDIEKLWELRGNVHIENLQKEIFDTSILFWNQQQERVWSDEYICIRQANGTIIKGYGFQSNQQFTNYTIRNTQGTFPIDEMGDAPRNANGEIVADSSYVESDSTPSLPESTPQEGVPEKAQKEGDESTSSAVRPSFETIEPAGNSSADKKKADKKPISSGTGQGAGTSAKKATAKPQLAPEE